MQRYIQEVNKLEKRVETENKWTLLKPAHAVTVKAILRTLLKEKMPKEDLLKAKKFLATTGYDEKGKTLDNLTASSYLEALKLREEKKDHVLNAVETTTRNLAQYLDEHNVETVFARNPVQHIISTISNVRPFLNRQEAEYYRGEINESEQLTKEQKAKLLKHLEVK